MRLEKSFNELKFIEYLKKPIKTKEEVALQEKYGQLLSEELKEECKQLINTLNSFGYKLNSVYDLVNTKEPYPKLIFTLADHLNSHFSKRTIEGIVRALTVKEARGIGLPRKLLDLYEKVPLDAEYEGFRWAITNAIWFTVLKKDKEIAPRLKKIIENEDDKIDKKRLIDTLKKLGE